MKQLVRAQLAQQIDAAELDQVSVLRPKVQQSLNRFTGQDEVPRFNLTIRT
jgi:hypothetical protein